MADRAANWGFRATPSIAAAIALVIHIAVAFVLFSVITAAAVGLNWITKLCAQGNLAPKWVTLGMGGLEIVLWAGDVLCFLLLVSVSVWEFFVTVLEGRGVH